jgi:hypothetical protein
LAESPGLGRFRQGAETLRPAEASPLAYAELLESARSVGENDDVALRGLARAAASAELSEERLDRLARIVSKSSKFSLPAVRKAFAQAASQRTAEIQADPSVQAAAKAAAAAVRQAEAAQSWSACKGLAFAPDLMDRVEAIGDRLGVVGERAAIRGAWSAFNTSVSALYGVRTRAEIVATVCAAEGMGAVKGGDSVKITVAAMRKALGINSNDVAASRLREAVEHGALEEDDAKRGLGRGSPRFFRLLIPSAELRAAPGRVSGARRGGKLRGRETVFGERRTRRTKREETALTPFCPSYPPFPKTVSPLRNFY